MAVSYVSAILANNADTSTSTVVTAPFALTGTNRALVVFVGITNSTARAISTIARGGDTFAAVNSATPPPSLQIIAQKSSSEPQTTSAALTVTMTNAFKNWSVGIHAAEGVDQTDVVDGFVVNADINGATVTAMAVATTTGDLVVDALVVRDDWSSAVPAGSQTDRGTTTSGGTPGSDYNQMRISSLPGSGSSVNMGWASGVTSGGCRHVAVNFIQGASNTAPTITAQASKRMVYGVANTIPFTVADTEDDALTVVVGCTSGTLTAALASGAGVTVDSGSGTSTLTLSGSVAQFTSMGSVEYTQSGYTSDTITWDVNDGNVSGTQDTTTITMHTAKFYGGDLANLNVVLETLGLTADTTGSFTLQMLSVDSAGNTDSDTSTITVTAASSAGAVISPLSVKGAASFSQIFIITLENVVLTEVSDATSIGDAIALGGLFAGLNHDQVSKINSRQFSLRIYGTLTTTSGFGTIELDESEVDSE